jgi:DNA polymerase III subunit delta'
VTGDGDEGGVKLPRETGALFGHDEAEQTLLASYQSGRVPHAWLIGGPPGIGKATLAYRFARFVLAHPDPGAAEVQKATSLVVDTDDPVARRIAAQAEPGLRTLERIVNPDTNKLYTVIRVDELRDVLAYFGMTGEPDTWRIAVVDAVDDLNASSANALLKVLEEPPERALLLLVSNAPGRVLPTIRSRCRRLLLRPLDDADVARAVASALGREAGDDILQAARVADGSVARALALLDEDAQALRQRVLDLIAQLPNPDPRALHALGDALGPSDPQTLETFMDLINGWLSAQLNQAQRSTPQMARVAEIWEKVNRAARDVEAYNLERKPFAFAVFGALAEAARS